MAEPIFKIKSGTQSVACFENKYTKEDGTKDVFYSLVIQRSYKDKEGNWQTQTINESPERGIVLAELIKSVAMKALEKSKPKQSNAQSSAKPQQTEDDDIPF